MTEASKEQEIDPTSDYTIKWVDYTDGDNQRRLYGQVLVFGPTVPSRLVVSRSETQPGKWQWLVSSADATRFLNLKRENVATAELAQQQCEEAFRSWVRSEVGFRAQDEQATAESQPGADGPGAG